MRRAGVRKIWHWELVNDAIGETRWMKTITDKVNDRSSASSSESDLEIRGQLLDTNDYAEKK